MKYSFHVFLYQDTVGFFPKTYISKEFRGLENYTPRALLHALAYAATCDKDVSKIQTVSSGCHILMNIKEVNGALLHLEPCLTEATTR